VSQTFKPASPSGLAIVWTLGYIGGFLFFAVRTILAISAGVSPDLFDVGGALILAAFIIFAWARAVKAYHIEDGELNITRMIMKGVTVPLDMVKSVQSDPEIGSFFNSSLFAIGGLFGWGGRAQVRKSSDVNALTAYVYGSNPKNSVIFRIDGDKTVIVTPTDPQGFVNAIRLGSSKQETPVRAEAATKKKVKRR
jgi:hypothetical protein